MPPDIKNGDFLVVGGTEYPIRSVAVWVMRPSMSVAVRRLARVNAETKRNPDVVAGKRAAPETNLTGLKCTPLDPIEPEIRERLAINTPHTLLQTFVTDNESFLHLVLEDLQA